MNPPRKRGRPKKVQDVEATEVATEPLQVTEIKHVFRVISVNNQFRSEGSQPAEVIEDYLDKNYFSQGYKLYDVIYTRAVPLAEGGILGHEMLYVLVK